MASIAEHGSAWQGILLDLLFVFRPYAIDLKLENPFKAVYLLA